MQVWQKLDEILLFKFYQLHGNPNFMPSCPDVNEFKIPTHDISSLILFHRLSFALSLCICICYLPALKLGIPSGVYFN